MFINTVTLKKKLIKIAHFIIHKRLVMIFEHELDFSQF